MRPLPAMALALLAACAAPAAEPPGMVPPESADAAPAVAAATGVEIGFIPSLAPRGDRPCGDIVGLSMSGPFTAAIVQLGETRSLVDATPEMIACVEANGLEMEFTSGG